MHFSWYLHSLHRFCSLLPSASIRSDDRVRLYKKIKLNFASSFFCRGFDPPVSSRNCERLKTLSKEGERKKYPPKDIQRVALISEKRLEIKPSLRYSQKKEKKKKKIPRWFCWFDRLGAASLLKLMGFALRLFSASLSSPFIYLFIDVNFNGYHHTDSSFCFSSFLPVSSRREENQSRRRTKKKERKRPPFWLTIPELQ